VTPWRSVIWPTPSGEVGFRRVTWREGTKGKMSSRFATERVVLAQDDLVDPSQRKRSGCSWNGRMARSSDGLTATTLPAKHVTAPARSESQAAVRTERVYEDAKESLGWITTRAAPSAAGTTMCPWCWFASRLSSPSAPGLFPPRPEKLPRGKRRIVTTVRTATPPERHFRDSLHHCAPGRRARPLGHMVPMPPLCHRPRSMDRLVHMPVNTDGRLPF